MKVQRIVKIGIIINLVKYLGVIFLITPIAIIFYAEYLIAQSVNAPKSPPPAFLVYFAQYVYLFMVPMLFSFVLFALAFRLSKKVYKDAVGKPLEIIKLNSTFEGFAKFEGMRVRIKCDQKLSPGDRVKSDSFEIVRNGRNTFYSLNVKKLSPGDADFEPTVVEP